MQTFSSIFTTFTHYACKNILFDACSTPNESISIKRKNLNLTYCITNLFPSNFPCSLLIELWIFKIKALEWKKKN